MRRSVGPFAIRSPTRAFRIGPPAHIEGARDLVLTRVDYSSYLKDQIRAELKSSGDTVTQITVLQGAIREL